MGLPSELIHAGALAPLLTSSSPLNCEPGPDWVAGPSPHVECELENAPACFHVNIWVVLPRFLPTTSKNRCGIGEPQRYQNTGGPRHAPLAGSGCFVFPIHAQKTSAACTSLPSFKPHTAATENQRNRKKEMPWVVLKKTVEQD